MGLGYLLRGRSGGRRSGSVKAKKTRGVAVIAGGDESTVARWGHLADQVSDVFLRHKWTLTYCGMGSGLAGATAKKVIEGGGRVRAVLIRGRYPDDIPRGVERVIVGDYYARQRRLFEDPTALLFLPGGVGTVAELTGATSLLSVGMIDKPVLLYDPDRWFEPITAFYAKAEAEKITSAPLLWRLHVVSDISEVASGIAGEMIA